MARNTCRRLEMTAKGYSPVTYTGKAKARKNCVTTGAHDGGRFDSSVQKVEQPNKKFP